MLFTTADCMSSDTCQHQNLAVITVTKMHLAEQFNLEYTKKSPSRVLEHFIVILSLSYQLLTCQSVLEKKRGGRGGGGRVNYAMGLLHSLTQQS